MDDLPDSTPPRSFEYPLGDGLAVAFGRQADCLRAAEERFAQEQRTLQLMMREVLGDRINKNPEGPDVRIRYDEAKQCLLVEEVEPDVG